MSYAGIGLGGTFAPDCYLSATGKADILGTPLSPAILAGYNKKYGAQAVASIAAICNQSASPADCMGQYFLKDAFLGRPCKGEWISHINERKLAPLPAPALPSAVVSAPPADNTMLYVGGALAAAVVIGGVFLATGKKKGKR